MAAVALFSGQASEFTVLLNGAADQSLLESIKDTDEMFRQGMFAAAAAVGALGEQLRGRQRGGRCSHQSVSRNSDDCVPRKKFLGMPGAAVGSMLGGKRRLICDPSRCSWKERTDVQDSRRRRGIGLPTDGAAAVPGSWERGGPNDGNSAGRLFPFISFVACVWMAAEHTQASSM